MAKFCLLPLIVLFYCNVGYGQLKKIDTDRPDQTESASIVPRGYFQAEVGFSKENGVFKNYDLVHPSALLKYGFRKFELRVESTIRSSYEQLIPNPKWTSGFDPLEVGCKVALFDETKELPKTSLIVHLGIPALSSKAFRTDHLAPSFRLVMQKSIARNVGIGTNVGAAWDGVATTPVWLYTLSPGFDLGERWYAYVEAFGFIARNETARHNLDAGVAYYISRDVKVDASGGIGISKASPKSYVALGISFRIKTGHSAGD